MCFYGRAVGEERAGLALIFGVKDAGMYLYRKLSV